MILLVDNYDSFVHNLARHFRRLGQATLVVRNDAMDVQSLRRLEPSAVVLSPGPCTPAESGVTMEIARQWEEIPVLGVCLGHQAIAAAYGAQIVRAGEPMHGRVSPIEHERIGLFAGLPSPMRVCRYHSLVVDPSSLSRDFRVTARTADGVIMAIAHRHRPLMAVQFHPEAILTEHGYALLANFLRLAGLEGKHDTPAEEKPPEEAHRASETRDDAGLRPAPLEAGGAGADAPLAYSTTRPI